MMIPASQGNSMSIATLIPIMMDINKHGEYWVSTWIATTTSIIIITTTTTTRIMIVNGTWSGPHTLIYNTRVERLGNINFTIAPNGHLMIPLALLPPPPPPPLVVTINGAPRWIVTTQRQVALGH